MKTMKQKTLTMALFGLLAANASWNLINQNGSNYFTGQLQMGQAVMASTSTETVASLNVASTATVDRYTVGNLIKDLREEGVTVETSSSSKVGFVTVKFTVDEDNQKKIKGFKDTLAALQSPEAKNTGILSVKSKKGEVDGTDFVVYQSKNEVKTYEILVQQTVDLGNEIEVVDRLGNKVKAKIKLTGKGIETDALSDPKAANYSVSIEATEGQDLSYCQDCLSGIDNLPIEIDKLEQGPAAIIEQIQKTMRARYTAELAAKAKADERVCLNFVEGSEERLTCLIARMEGKDFDGDKIRGAVRLDKKGEKKMVKDLLSDILTAEYKDDLRSDYFDDYLKGTTAFRRFHDQVKKDVRKQVKKEEEIEANEERTEMLTEAMDSELERINDIIGALDESHSRFEYMVNYATRDLDAMKWQCDSYSPYYQNSQSRSYFGSSYSAGMSFNTRDGFNTWAGPTNTSSMTTFPSRNAIGGNNQFNQMQQQWDQWNRQNAEMERQNCMTQLASAEQYYNWELSSYEDSRVKPLQWEIDNSLNRLDAKRLFKATYKKDKDYNGGLHRDELNDYIEQINAFKRDVQGMGTNTYGMQQSNNDILYTNTRSNVLNSGARRGNPQSYTSGPSRVQQQPTYRNNNTGVTTQGRQSVRGSLLR